MRGLLDVNVLVTLFDVDHVFHSRAHECLNVSLKAGIATYPLTENGWVRILSHPRYSAALRVSPAEIIRRLSRFCGVCDHQFWSNAVTLRDSELSVEDRILGSKQITDIYLLGLAVYQKGRMVAFDEGVEVTTVRGADPRHRVVI